MKVKKMPLKRRGPMGGHGPGGAALMSSAADLPDLPLLL